MTDLSAIAIAGRLLVADASSAGRSVPLSAIAGRLLLVDALSARRSVPLSAIAGRLLLADASSAGSLGAAFVTLRDERP